MKGKLLYTLVPVLTAIISLISCSSNKDEQKNSGVKSPQPVVRVDAFIVSTRPIVEDIESPGSLTSFEETELHPEVPGRITGLHLNEGGNTSKGSLLVKLYDADLQAQLKKLQVQLAIAKKTETRQSELLKIGGLSQQDYDISLLDVNNLEADIDIIRTSISKTEIRAPFSGKLGLRNVSMGAYVTPQTIITTIRQTNQLKLEFTVPEKYGAKMKIGESINFTVDGNDKNFAARVIANENNIAADSRSLKIKAVVDKPDPLLIAGSFARVKLIMGENNTALMIPTQAVIPQARNKQVIVYRNGMAAMQVVTTGIRDSANVEITNGLKEGDTVIITGLQSIKPGAAIQLNKIAK